MSLTKNMERLYQALEKAGLPRKPAGLPSGAGWEPAPGSKMGAWRRHSSSSYSSWVYWYPGGHEAPHLGDVQTRPRQDDTVEEPALWFHRDSKGDLIHTHSYAVHAAVDKVKVSAADVKKLRDAGFVSALSEKLKNNPKLTAEDKSWLSRQFVSETHGLFQPGLIAVNDPPPVVAEIQMKYALPDVKAAWEKHQANVEAARKALQDAPKMRQESKDDILAHSAKLADHMKRAGLTVVKLWSKPGVGPRVYFGTAGFITVDHNGDIATELRGRETFRRDLFYPNQRKMFDAGLASFRAERSAESAKASSAPATPKPAGSKKLATPKSVDGSFEAVATAKQAKIESALPAKKPRAPKPAAGSFEALASSVKKVSLLESKLAKVTEGKLIKPATGAKAAAKKPGAKAVPKPATKKPIAKAMVQLGTGIDSAASPLDIARPPKVAMSFRGLQLTIENPAGTYRGSDDPNGWRTFMTHHYGEIDGTLGADGEPVDVYVGPHMHAPMACVVSQQTLDGRFDEFKVMLGFVDEREAVDAYKRHYNTDGFYHSHTCVNVDGLLEWLNAARGVSFPEPV